MTARITKRLGRIEVPAEAAVVDALARSRGLRAEPAEAPGHFYLVSSGRNLASETESALLAETTAALDEAVHAGAIPHWSLVS